MQCPECNRELEDRAIWCDCGRDLRSRDPRTPNPIALRPMSCRELARRPWATWGFRWIDQEGLIRKGAQPLAVLVWVIAALAGVMAWNLAGPPRDSFSVGLWWLFAWGLVVLGVRAFSSYDLATWQHAPRAELWVALATLFCFLPGIAVYFWLLDRERAYVRAMREARGENWRVLAATRLRGADLDQHAPAIEPGSLPAVASHLGVAAVILVVLLRLTIGWHFLYEGVWKIRHADEFSAEPFLTQAKGPLASWFYAMVPDIDGRERLKIQKGPDGQPQVTAPAYLVAWNRLRQEHIDYYRLTDAQAKQAQAVYDRYKRGLETFLAENREDILGYFDSLDRFQNQQQRSRNEGAAFQRQRIWDRQQELRAEVREWLRKIDAMGESYRWALWEVLTPQQQRAGPLAAPLVETQRLPIRLGPVATKSELLDATVTYALTAIGLCLMLGLCTRLAALGGAGFLAFVVLTQWPWPTVYPPLPEVVGHALWVDKNVVELVALLVLAALPAGRWGGLDELIYRWFGRRVLRGLVKRCCKKSAEGT